MKSLDQYTLVLPQFENDQELFAEHLNAMNAFFSALLLRRFSARPKGIVRGFAVTVDERRKLLCVSPGLAVDATGRLIFLPEERKIALPETPAEAITVVFAIKIEIEPPKPANEALGKFQSRTCWLGYVSGEALASEPELVEIARVKFDSRATPLAEVLRAPALLNPQAHELDLREVIWLGETEVGFLRPELQHELAALTALLTAEVQLAQLSLAQLQALVTTPAFCRRGLLSRAQLVDFINALALVHKSSPESLADCSNTQLVQKLQAMRNEAPAEINLTRERLSGMVDLKRHETVTVRINYGPGLLGFVLTLQRGANGQVMTRLSDYPKEFSDCKVFHTWNENDLARNQPDYIGARPPVTINFYANAPMGKDIIGIRQRLFKCRFSEQGQRFKVEMQLEKVEQWPRITERR